MPFSELRLIEPLLRAVRSEGYTIPTAIQKQAIPHVLAGKDLMGCAQTGTGKTAAFALPIIQRLHAQPAAQHAPQPTHAAPHAAQHADTGTHRPQHAPQHAQTGRYAAGPTSPIRALILTPTRELAAQIGESFRVYGQHAGLKHTVIFGGVGQGPQVRALRNGVDILVATPGRLLDLLGQRCLVLDRIEIFVLDEADRMLDMGFIHDIRRIIALIPKRRQTLMFSATMPSEIRSLAGTILQSPMEVHVPAESPAADTVSQTMYLVDQPSKTALLEHLLRNPEMSRTLVFTRTKHRADRVVRSLTAAGIAAAAIHSNKSQNARLRALADFKKGATRVLVASDIAARGLDVDDISHVVNFDLPNEPETYIHRIGRTGRAGATGKAISFCCEDQRAELRDIERLLGRKIPASHMPEGFVRPKPDPQSQADDRREQYSRNQYHGRRGYGQQSHGQARSQHAQAAEQTGTPDKSQGAQHTHGQHSQQAQGTQGQPPASHPPRRSHSSGSPEQQQKQFWRQRRKPPGGHSSSGQGRRGR